MGLNGPVTWKQITGGIGLVAVLSGTIGSYYVMGYRVDAAEKAANKALEATAEIPVIKQAVEYIKQEVDKNTARQDQVLRLLEEIRKQGTRQRIAGT